MVNPNVEEFVLDQLGNLRGVSARVMFGGYGLYREGVFFGIIPKGWLYLKTDDRTRSHYVAHGMKPFLPNAKQTLKSYYEVPVDVIEDSEQLTDWASKAIRSN